MTPSQKMGKEFADHAKAMGFTVYLAKTGTYGFLTDNDGMRVLCFDCDHMRGTKLSGNYQPSKNHGTGWQIAESVHLPRKDELQAYLYTPVPNWITRPVQPFTTVEQHLDRYGRSSGYTKH